MIAYFKALADSTRLRIAGLLFEHELNVNEIITVLDMGQSRISRHLKILAESGLVTSRRDGLWVFYSATDTAPGKDFLVSLRPFIEKTGFLASDLSRLERLRKESTKQSGRFFDGLAPDWPHIKKDILGGFDLDAVVAENMKKCGIACDLGCGPGDILPVLKRKAAHVIGVDNSSQMLQSAKNRFSGTAGYDFRIGEMEHLPLRDSEVDFVLMSFVLHHLSDPVEGLREANRILKTGHDLLVIDLVKHKDESLRQKYGDRRLGFANAEISRWLNEAGFVIRKNEKFGLNRGLKADLFLAVKRKDIPHFRSA
jgi:DNA-binding transcriptional ArsR family regulator